MSYYNKYQKYKNKYLELKSIQLSGNLDINSKKPLNISSVKIQDQGSFGTCWVHAISRMFVRTFQILDIIKPQYKEQYYELFYTILLKKKDCNEGGRFEDIVYLFNYLKNHNGQLVTIKKKNIKCINDKCTLDNDQTILQLNLEEQIQLKNDLQYLFTNKLIFLAKYQYDPNNDINKPTKAIKTMLDYRLQPCVSIKISDYLNNFIDEKIKNKNNKYELLPINNSISIKSNCISSTPRHSINLRSWFRNKIEFKNSWGDYGNFAITDLKYLTCNHDEEIVLTEDTIEFRCLLFDYDNLNNEFKKKVDDKLKLYHHTFDPTFDPSIDIGENTNYKCLYDKYGFLDGKNCELKFNNDVIYNGSLKYGIENGKGIKIYSDKSKYEGDWENGLEHGKGIQIYLNEKYEGEWRDGQRNGKGIQIYSDLSKYEGEWKGGKKNGKGIQTYFDGSKYEGEWKDDKKHNKGIITYSDGSKYVSEWKDGKRNGKGTETYLDGSKYEGEWIDGKKTGKGIQTYLDGSKYVSEWKDGKRNGKGTEIYLDGSKYEGEWKGGERNGKGIETLLDQSKYEGEWRSDERNGKGIETLLNGSKYEGEWKGGQRNGKGIETLLDGSKYEGEWRGGQRNGKGIETLPNGLNYEGEWKKGQKNGKIIETLPNGSKYESNWINDIPIGKITDLSLNETNRENRESRENQENEWIWVNKNKK